MRRALGVGKELLRTHNRAVRFKIDNEASRSACIRAIGSIDIEQAPIVTIGSAKNRSLELNALYWKWLTALSEQMYMTKDELHEKCKEQFCLPIMVREHERYPGFAAMWAAVKAAKSRDIERGVIRLASTATLETKDFREMLKDIEYWYVEAGFRLPAREQEVRPYGAA